MKKLFDRFSSSRIRPYLLIFVLLGGLISLGVFVGSNLYRNTNVKINEDPIRLVVDTWAGYIPLYVAYENGFFDDEGVSVNFDMFVNSYEVAEKIEEIDSHYDGYPSVYPQSFSSGNIDFNSSAVYVFDYSYGGDVIIGDFSIKSIEDLNGKRVSVVVLNSFSHRFLISLLEKNGLSEDDVEIVEVSAYDVLDAIEKGEIDAGHTWDPVKSEALEKGYNLIGSSKETPGLIIDVLAIKKSVIEEREQDVQRIVNALNKAYDFIEKNKDEAYSLMSNKTGVSLSDLMGMSSGIKLVSPDENVLFLTDSGTPVSLYPISKDISDFMIKHSQLNKSFSAEDLIDSRFIK